MSKYIDAELYVEMQIYDDEHEEWGIWNGTIEELLDQWTEQGCPSAIEVSEGEWLKRDVCEYRCANCGKIQFADCDHELNYCCNCGSRNKWKGKYIDRDSDEGVRNEQVFQSR